MRKMCGMAGRPSASWRSPLGIWFIGRRYARRNGLRELLIAQRVGSRATQQSFALNVRPATETPAEAGVSDSLIVDARATRPQIPDFPYGTVADHAEVSPDSKPSVKTTSAIGTRVTM